MKRLPKEFGLLVTSNASQSHIVWRNDKAPCGVYHKLFNTKYPNSEVRWYIPTDEFKKFVEDNRFMPDDGYRFCKRCLKAFDKLMELYSNANKYSNKS